MAGEANPNAETVLLPSGPAMREVPFTVSTPASRAAENATPAPEAAPAVEAPVVPDAPVVTPPEADGVAATAAPVAAPVVPEAAPLVEVAPEAIEPIEPIEGTVAAPTAVVAAPEVQAPQAAQPSPNQSETARMAAWVQQQIQTNPAFRLQFIRDHAADPSVAPYLAEIPVLEAQLASGRATAPVAAAPAAMPEEQLKTKYNELCAAGNFYEANKLMTQAQIASQVAPRFQTIEQQRAADQAAQQAAQAKSVQEQGMSRERQLWKDASARYPSLIQASDTGWKFGEKADKGFQETFLRLAKAQRGEVPVTQLADDTLKILGRYKAPPAKRQTAAGRPAIISTPTPATKEEVKAKPGERLIRFDVSTPASRAAEKMGR